MSADGNTRRAAPRTTACLGTYVVLFAVVREGRKPPSAPEFGTPHDDVCRGRSRNVQFSRVRITELPQKIQRGVLGNPVRLCERPPAVLWTYRLCVYIFLTKLQGGYFEEAHSHFEGRKGGWFCEMK